MDKKVKNQDKIALDNKTIAKLAIAIATAIELQQSGEAIGPLTHKVLTTLDNLDTKVQYFVDYEPKG